MPRGAGVGWDGGGADGEPVAVVAAVAASATAVWRAAMWGALFQPVPQWLGDVPVRPRPTPGSWAWRRCIGRLRCRQRWDG